MNTLKHANRRFWPVLTLILTVACYGAAQTNPPAAVRTGAPPPKATGVPGATAATPTTPAPPPGAPAKRSAADLEKLVAPIALYPDPLIATLLPASVYPLEIVQAARFVANTNNLAMLDAQPWDNTVKALARVPDAIKKLNEDIAWTIELGEAFLAQDKDVMDAIQAMREKARKAGTLQTTSQQIVTVTNMVVETTVEQKVVVVTNTVVQIQPADSSVIYVPTYNPYVVYYPPPTYVYNPVAPLVTFTAGVAMGAIIANNCNWYHGGCYHGDVDIDIDRNVNIDRDGNRNANRDGAAGGRTSATSTQKKWQPDQSRLNKSGSPSAATRESRGWSGASAQPTQRPSAGASAARPTQQPARPPAQRPASPTAGSRPSGAGPQASPSRPTQSPSVSPSRAQPSSAFGGVNNGSNARSASNRGAASRGGGGGRGGGRGR